MAVGQGTVNKVILLGRLGRDPNMRYTPAGAAVADFSLATNRVYTDANGNQIKKTDWHRIVVWRKLAEVANNYLKKGSLVYIEGRLETRSWTDQNNVTRYMTEVIGEILQMVGPKADRPEAPMEEPQVPEELPTAEPEAPPPEPSEDDLPF